MLVTVGNAKRGDDRVLLAGTTDKNLFIVDSLCLSIVRVIKRQLDGHLKAWVGLARFPSKESSRASSKRWLEDRPRGRPDGIAAGSLLGALQGDLMEQGVFVRGDDPRTVSAKGCVSIAYDTAKLNQLRS